MYRQGDVLINKIQRLPAGLTKQKATDKIILAYGEVTGHCHAIEEISKVKSFIDGSGKLYLDVRAKTVVEHQEHDAIVLGPGVYEVIRQREYSPEAIRNVAD